jgi:biopolymer transport protein TolR
MAGIIGAGGHGGKRPVDTEIHLVPFIDLLCSLISFLLMTAVWSQISRLELKNGSDAPPDQQTPPPEEKKMMLKVHIHDKGFTVVEQSTDVEIQIPCTSGGDCYRVELRANAQGKQVPELTSHFDYAKLQTTLETEKAKYTNQKDVSIVLGDKIPYNEMIKTMDTCLVIGLDGISLSGTMM